MFECSGIIVLGTIFRWFALAAFSFLPERKRAALKGEVSKRQCREGKKDDKETSESEKRERRERREPVFCQGSVSKVCCAHALYNFALSSCRNSDILNISSLYLIS